VFKTNALIYLLKFPVIQRITLPSGEGRGVIMALLEISPRIMQRTCGGWLAVAPPGAVFRIGETGETEQQAVERFHEAWRQWADIVAVTGPTA
jgi:hypothetical protein